MAISRERLEQILSDAVSALHEGAIVPAHALARRLLADYPDAGVSVEEIESMCIAMAKRADISLRLDRQELAG